MPGTGTGQLSPNFALQQGRYVILARVGMGGMSVIYRAADTRLNGRTVAIKEMSDAAFISTQDKQQAVVSFLQEAQMLARLDHPKLPKVTDFFTENGKYYIVMEFVEGKTLEDHLRQRRQPVSEAEIRGWAAQLCEVLDYLHRQIPPVIFRDLKPANVMLIQEGDLKLIDFGIARFFKADRSGDTVTMGTPGYASPEQLGGDQTDVRSDVYSLGVLLHQMLTRHDPTTTPFNLPPVRQLNPSVSPQIEQVIAKAVQTDRLQRFQSIEDFRRALDTEPSFPVRTQVGSSPSGCLPWFLPLAALSALGLAIITGSAYYLFPVEVPNLDHWINLLRFNWHWIALGLIILFLVVGGSQVGQLRLRIGPTKPGLNSRIAAPPPAVPSYPMPKWRTANFTSNELRPAHDEWFTGDHSRVIEDLVLQEDFDSLKTWIVNATGERFLLTGYGRFGGTSLVRGAVQKALRELSARGSGNVLALYFSVRDRNAMVQEFAVEANQVFLGILTAGANEDMLESQANDTQREQALTTSQVFKFELSNPIDRSFFSGGFRFGRALRKRSYGFTELSNDLDGLTESSKSPSDLQRIITQLLGNEELPSRVVVILDRIRHLETLEELTQSKLLSNPQIGVIAVARKEDMLSWEAGSERLDGIGFRVWPIPCLWDENLITEAVKVILQPPDVPTAEAERNLGILYKHLAYVGRGSLGRVLEELRTNERPWIWKTDSTNGYYLQLDPLPHASELEHNAWKQEMLQKNWGTILPRHLSGTHPLCDQARIGVYYLMDWIDGKTSFTLDELRSAADTTPITISNDESTRTEVVNRLLYVLKAKAHAYLRPMDGRYVVQWSDRHLREPRQIRYRRAKSNVTVEQQQVRFRRDNLHLDIIVEQVTDTSTPSTKMDERQTSRQIKILTVFANPKGSDKSRLDEEDRTIKECVAQCQQRDNLHLKSIPAARVRDLQLALMADHYQVVHFSSYATDTGELQFEDDNGEAKPVPKEALANLLRLHSSIECVILNARHTLSQGQLIASGVTYTIAMDGPISHEASRFFVRGFYDAVGSGKNYADAFQQGRVALGLEGFSSEVIVVPKLLDQSSGSF